MTMFNPDFWKRTFPDEFIISQSPAIDKARTEDLAMAIHEIRQLMDQFSDVTPTTHTLLTNEHASRVLWSCRMALEIKLKERGLKDNQIEKIQETGRLPK